MRPRVFVVDYRFLACGDVFTHGLAHAAQELGLTYEHAEARHPNLEALVRRFAPDLLLVVHGRMATPRLAKILPTVPSGIWLLDEPYEVDDTSRFSGQYGHAFVCDHATLHRHQRSSYLPVCYDPQVHMPGAGDRPYAVGFIGGGNPTRDRYLAALARAGHLSYVIGGAWQSPAVNRLTVSRNVAPAETAARYQQTRIVLNVFREVHHYNREHIAATSLNPRVYEALACGALVVSEWRPEADTLLPEMPTFHTVDQCLEVMGDLLAHPEKAEALRLACLARVAPHTYTARLATMLTALGIETAKEAA
jgi:hypothetical protein